MADVPQIPEETKADSDAPSGGKSSIETRQDDLERLMQYVVLVLLFMTASLIAQVGGIVWDAHQNEAEAERALTQQMRSLQDCVAEPASCKKN